MHILTVSASLSHDQILDKVDFLAVDINGIVLHHVLEHHLGGLFVCPVGSWNSLWDEFIVKNMTEGTMT